MTLYNKFKTYSLDPNKISVFRGRLHPNRWYVVVRNGGIEYVGGTYEDAVKEINKWVRLHEKTIFSSYGGIYGTQSVCYCP